MTTDPANIPQLHSISNLPDLDRGAVQASASGPQDDKAANTRRAYASSWRHFQAWTDATGV